MLSQNAPSPITTMAVVPTAISARLRPKNGKDAAITQVNTASPSRENPAIFFMTQLLFRLMALRFSPRAQRPVDTEYINHPVKMNCGHLN